VLDNALEEFEFVLTNGGAWKSERDLVVHILDEPGWEKVFHRIKMGPGKVVWFGFSQGKPVFLLPGGPPSNHMTFLQLAFSAVKTIAGWREVDLPLIIMQLAETLKEQIDWTQFIHGRLIKSENGQLAFTSTRQKSRLQMMAASDPIVKQPDGWSGYRRVKK